MNLFYKIFILIFLNGFISIITQIVLYREILSQVYANELVLSFALSAWLIAGAVAGVVVFPKYFKNKSTNFLFSGFGLFPILVILLAIVALIILRNIKTILNIPIEQIINIWDAIIITIFFYGPASFILTLSFSFAGEIIKRINGDAKLLYITDTAGSIAAGVLFTLFIAGKYSNLELLYWLGIVCIVASYILYRDQTGRKIVNSILVFVLLIYLIPLLTNYLKRIDENSFIRPYYKYNIVLKKEGQDSRAVIAEKNDEYFVFSNGSLKYQSKDPDYSEFFGWAMLSGKDIKNVLLVNGAYTGGIKEIKRYKGIEKITALETDTDVAGLLEKILQTSADYENVEFVHGDLIYYLYNLNKMQKYDLVLLNLPAPDTFINNRYFTLEFYKLLKNYLNENGLIAFSMPFTENILQKEIFYSISPVYRTIKEVFSNVEIISGEKIIFIASDGGITLSPEKILAGLKKQNLKIPQLNYVYINEKLEKSADVKKMLDNSNAKTNKILEPETYLRSIKKDLFMFKKSSNFIKAAFILFLFIYVLYKLIKSGKNYKNFFSYLSIFLFSSTAIMLEMSLILIYQSFYGYLYRSIGLLYSFFMLGTLIGAILFMIFDIKNFKLTVVLNEMLNVIVLLYVLNFKSIEQPVNPNMIMFLIIAAGFFIGAMFNLMLKNAELSVLYGADLVGGAAGGIIFGLIIFPLTGFTGIIIFNILLLSIAYVGGFKNV